MKKFFVFLALLMFSSPVMAKTIQLEALNDFSTENPPKTLDVKVLSEIVLDEKTTLSEGDVVHGQITDISDPKRLKRDASFTFVPLYYINNAKTVVHINGYFPAKYATKLDKGGLAKSAALGVGSYFVKGLSIGYSAVEGAVKNEDDGRLKSGAKAAYESSPFSYVEKGSEIVISKGQNFLLNFKLKDEADEPNYEYTTPAETNI